MADGAEEPGEKDKGTGVSLPGDGGQAMAPLAPSARSRTFVKKIGLVGDAGVGKKTIASAVAFSDFDDTIVNMIGAKVSKYGVKLSYPELKIRLSIMMWDLTGANLFDHIRPRYLLGVEAVVIVGDASRPETIESMRRWAAEVTANVKKPIVLLFIANKSDLADRKTLVASKTILEDLALKYDTNYYVMSARTGRNVRIPFIQLGRTLCQRQLRKDAAAAAEEKALAESHRAAEAGINSADGSASSTESIAGGKVDFKSDGVDQGQGPSVAGQGTNVSDGGAGKP